MKETYKEQYDAGTVQMDVGLHCYFSHVTLYSRVLKLNS